MGFQTALNKAYEFLYAILVEHLIGFGFRDIEVESIGGFFWLLAFRLINVLSFFQQGWRWILFVPLAPVFGLLLPGILYFLDPLDRKRDYTLGFFSQGVRHGD